MDAYTRYMFEVIMEEKKTDLVFFEEMFKECCDYNLNQNFRMKNFAFLVELYYNSEEIQAAYNYYPEAKKYPTRFIKVGCDTECFDDGIDYDAPDEPGLYFIGETHFNPKTDEKYYWVKVGKARSLKNRMKQYNTCNPMLWRIGFSKEYDKEEHYHQLLANVAIAKCNHNEEWFLVNRETYLEMCEKGFSYFS